MTKIERCAGCGAWKTIKAECMVCAKITNRDNPNWWQTHQRKTKDTK